MERIRCNHCKHEWTYTGKRRYYTTCPECHYNVNILKNRVNRRTDVKIDSYVNAEQIREVNTEKGVKITCKKCNYSWIYHGKLKVVRCNSCNARIHLDREK